MNISIAARAACAIGWYAIASPGLIGTAHATSASPACEAAPQRRMLVCDDGGCIRLRRKALCDALEQEKPDGSSTRLSRVNAPTGIEEQGRRELTRLLGQLR